MTAKASALVRLLEKRQAKFQKRAISTLRTLSPNDRLKAMVKAGILTKKGKLTTSYRPHVAATAAR